MPAGSDTQLLTSGDNGTEPPTIPAPEQCILGLSEPTSKPTKMAFNMNTSNANDQTAFMRTVDSHIYSEETAADLKPVWGWTIHRKAQPRPWVQQSQVHTFALPAITEPDLLCFC